MLKYAYNDGANLQIMNRQNLTPLTLAAKLAKKMVPPDSSQTVVCHP